MAISINKRNNLIIQNRFILLPLLSSVLFYLYNIYQSQLYMLTGLLFIFLPLLLYTSEKNLYVLLFCISNERMFRPISGGQTFIALFIALFAIKIMMEKKFKFQTKIIIYGILLIILMLLKNMVIKDLILDMDIIRLILNGYILMSILDLYKEKMSDVSRNSIIWYSVGCLTTGALSLFYQLNSGRAFMTVMLNRFGGINNDSNYYAVSIAIAISLLIVYYFTSKNGKSSILFLIISLFVLGGISLSRGFIVANIPNVFLFLILFSKSGGRKKIQFMLFVFFVLILAATGSVFDQIIQNYSFRMSVDTLDSGRLFLWSTYIDALMTSPINLFFGLGSYNKDLFYALYGVLNVPHNILIGSLVTFGLILTIGIIALFLSLQKYFKIKLGAKKWKLHYYLPLTTALIGYSLLDAITANVFFYGFFLSLVAAYLMYLSDNEKKVFAIVQN